MPAPAAPAEAVTLALPTLGTDNPPLLHLAAASDPWDGPMTLWRSLDGASFAPVAEIVSPAALGESLSILPPGPVWRWSQAVLDVNLPGADLSSIGDLTAMAGGQRFAIGPAAGPFEIIAAASAELIGPDRWRLTRLLRGLHGTETLADRTLAAGALVVLIDERLAPLERGLASIGQAIAYRLTAPGKDHGDAMAAAFTATPDITALRPLSPVHARVKREAGGLRIRFIRRTRIEGDNWALAEVPLGEEAPAFVIDILSGATLKTPPQRFRDRGALCRCG